MNQQIETRRVLGRILAQQISADESIALAHVAGGILPVTSTTSVVHCLPYGFTDSIERDGVDSRL
jgi:hypothetical protein